MSKLAAIAVLSLLVACGGVKEERSDASIAKGVDLSSGADLSCSGSCTYDGCCDPACDVSSLETACDHPGLRCLLDNDDTDWTQTCGSDGLWHCDPGQICGCFPLVLCRPDGGA